MANKKEKQQVLHQQALASNKIKTNQSTIRDDGPLNYNADFVSSQGKDPTSWWLRTRIHIALLGLIISAVNCYAQAAFCIAIVEMVLPADYVMTKSENQTSIAISTPSPLINDLLLKVPVASQQSQQSAAAVLEGLWNKDQSSCPIEYKYKDYYDEWRFPQSNNSTSPTLAPTSQTIDTSNRFDWDASKQGILLGAFAVGTALQVIGGRLAEIYGAKWVLFASCLGTAITNLAIPYLAHFSYILLVVNRVVMGVAQAGMEPGLICLLAKWLTPTETGFYISMLLFAMCTGFFLGSLCSSSILSYGYGWPLVYYISGGLNLLVASIWLFYADSGPKLSKYISQDEKNFIESEQRGVACSKSTTDPQPKSTITTINSIDLTGTALENKFDQTSNQQNINISAQSEEDGGCGNSSNISSNTGSQCNFDSSVAPLSGNAPWRNFLTTRSVWAFIICKFSIRWCADVIANELPTYLANVLHLSIKLNGILNSISSALFAIASFFIGWCVTKILTSEGFKAESKTNVRKIFQSIASFGSALAVILMTTYDCNIIFSMSMLLVVSCLIVMGSGGELQIPYDMTSKYTGTLHGMACTMSVSGWLAPPLIGLILGDQPSSRYRWSIVWYLTAAINLIGGLVFVMFADSSPRDFDEKRVKKSNVANNNDKNMDHQVMDTAGCILIRLKNNNDLEWSTNNNGQQYYKQQKQLAKQDKAENEGYYNIACRTLDSSPTQTKRGLQERKLDDDELIEQNQLASSSGLYFDSKLIRIRQTEASFIKPNGSYYASNLDSPLASCRIVFPYREKPAADHKTATEYNDKQMLRQASGSLPFKFSHETTNTSAALSNPILSSSSSSFAWFSNWPLVGQIRRRRRRGEKRMLEAAGPKANLFRVANEASASRCVDGAPDVTPADAVGSRGFEQQLPTRIGESTRSALETRSQVLRAESGRGGGGDSGRASQASNRLQRDETRPQSPSNGLQPLEAGKWGPSGLENNGPQANRDQAAAAAAAASESCSNQATMVDQRRPPNGSGGEHSKMANSRNNHYPDHMPPAELGRANQLLPKRCFVQPPEARPMDTSRAPKTITHL